MRRRGFIALIGTAAVLLLFRVPVARAQEPGRTYKIGILTGAARQAPRMVAFFDELKELGFVEGQNLKIVAGGFDLREDQYADVAATLAKAAPDVVLGIGDAAIRAVQQSAYAGPIVVASSDLVASGFVHSLAHPGGNTTGISVLGFEVDGKRLEILMQVVPSARRIAVLADPRSTQPADLKPLEDAARARGVELVIFTARVPEEITPAMDKAKASGATALNVLTSAMFSFNRRIVIERAAALGLPAIYEWPEMAEEGGLIAYGPRLTPIYRQVARVVVKVLRGAKPEDIPVVQPTNFELVINLTTAKALGLTIPESVLVGADKVIE
jgi:putative tryptophan/tyrosine transport system substrate-binding protein